MESISKNDEGQSLWKMEYYRIDEAAERLKKSTNELLHLGALGKMEFIAPVMVDGYYELEITQYLDTLFPELEKLPRYYFDAHDRVILYWKDVARIEARGWVVPDGFFYPRIVQQLDEILISQYKLHSKAEPDQVLTVMQREKESLLSEVALFPYKLSNLTNEVIEARKEFYSAPWFLVDTSNSNNEKTTISHLFVSSNELERFEKGFSQGAQAKGRQSDSQKKEHGNTRRFADTRQSVLMAAIYCFKYFPDRCKNIREIAALIDENADRFWKDEGVPPLERDTIERLIGEALKSGDKK